MCHDRDPVKVKLMSENAIDSENISHPAVTLRVTFFHLALLGLLAAVLG
jgi:hypothetical protein